MIGSKPPLYLTDTEIAPHDGQLQRRVLRPEQNLTCAAEFPELVENEPDRISDPLIGISFDLSDLVLAIAARQGKAQLATSRF